VDLGTALLWYVALLFSLCCPEAAHAWAAKRGGDPTAYLAGQVSLDPRPHIRREPFGTVIMPLFAFVAAGWMIGWASTPYDPHWAARHPRRAAWMALAGPAANLALVVAAALLVRIGIAGEVFVPPPIFDIEFDRIVDSQLGGVWATLAMFASILFSLNVLLFVFNLIPVPPLDGAGAIALFVPEPVALRMQQTLANPTIAFVGLFAAWIAIRQLLPPIHRAAIRVLYPELSYLGT
jgi:Zn-dependent protease